MENQYQTTLIPSDFEGNVNNPFDCIGSRSFSRAVGKPMFWGAYEGYNYDKENDKEFVFKSYCNDHPVDMMEDVKVGDIITFKKL